MARPSFGKPTSEAVISNSIIGAPYDTFTKSIVSTGSCLSGGISSYLTNGSSNLTFDQIQYQDSLFKSLGVSLGIDAEAGPVKMSLTAEFVSSSLDDSKSINMYFIEGSTSMARIKGVVSKVGSEAINGLKSAYQDYYLFNQEQFRLLCGTGYVEAARAGALLIVRLTLKFDSEVAKDEFEGKMNADAAGGLLDITAKIKKAVTDTKQNATLTINALQQGGNPLKVVGIFGISEAAASDAEAAGQVVFPAMDCGTGANVDEACQKTIASIIKYGKENMPEQVKNGSNLYYDLPEAVPYSHIGLDENTDIENKQIKLFSSEYVKANKSMLVIDYYAVEKFLIDINVNLLKELGSISTKLRYQINSVFLNEEITNYCYTAYSPGKCQKNLDWANGQLNDNAHKLQPDEKADLEYLELNQYELGGSGLWRGEQGIGACGFIPVTTFIRPVTAVKEGQFALDCGLGKKGNPIRKIVARIKDSEDKNGFRYISEIKLLDLSYNLRDKNGLHYVECLAADDKGIYSNKELTFKPQAAGSSTYFAKNIKCYKDKEEFGIEDEDALTLERKS
ncbi:MAG TPA: hypothetical protein VKR58_12575, partial [Aquella sp.]|nr:hypothetical protein [Aquella sp.]